MIILEHSTYGERTIGASLGLSEYSYWFVRKAFEPVLERFGTMVPVAAPDEDVDRIFRSAQAHGQACVFLSFNPPHRTPLRLACPTVPVFAWEFDTIPDEVWNDEAENDWTHVLSQAPASITHSQFSARVVRRALGADYPIWSIPAPVADRRAGLEQSARGWREGAELKVSDAFVFDTWAIDLSLFSYGSDVRSARLLRLLQSAARQTESRARSIQLQGVVYSSVLNPMDGRKNWLDMLAAFVYAFRAEPGATLILKTINRDLEGAVTPILQNMAKLQPFKCRILIVHGMLSDAEYTGLIEATSYTVNASHGEGQCLPLMEFMAAGRPAVAPRHTAMLEYVSQDNAFVVADHHRPSAWPHDMRQVTRCLRHQVEFGDLVRRYRESFLVARDRPDQYAHMSRAAVAALHAFCSDSVVEEGLRQVFGHLQAGGQVVEAPLTLSEGASIQTPALAPPDGFRVGLRDAGLTGWYNGHAGEMAPGFPISADDVLVDVGCGDGGPAAFCARLGAHIILADVNAARVEQAAQRLRDGGASRVEAHVTDANPLPLADALATRVVCMEVLEHVEDPSVLMGELVRVGRPGALYLITVPGDVSEKMQTHLAPPEYFERPNHIRIIDSETFEKLVTSAGLHIEHKFSYGFYWALWWVFFWQCSTSLEAANEDALLASWATTWALMLDRRDGPRIQGLLNGLMPKSQVIVARKPG